MVADNDPDDRPLIGRKDRMELRALMEGWDLPPEARKALLNKILRALANPETTSIRDLERIDRIFCRNTKLQLEIEQLIAEEDAAKNNVSVNVAVGANQTIAYLREARSAPRPVIDDEEIRRVASATRAKADEASEGEDPRDPPRS